MGKRTVSFVFNLIRLAIVLSLVVFGMGSQNGAFAVDSDNDVSPLVIVVPIDSVKFDCSVVEARGVPDRHDGKFYSRTCCGTACSIFAILIPVAAVRFVRQTNIKANADCLKLASFISQNLHRPPIARISVLHGGELVVRRVGREPSSRTVWLTSTKAVSGKMLPNTILSLLVAKARLEATATRMVLLPRSSPQPNSMGLAFAL
jgi:hypothetical protein